MTEWRFNERKLVPVGATVVDVFPDVERTVIYRDLLEFGIDAREIAVSPQENLGSVMGITLGPTGIFGGPPQGSLLIETSTVDLAYPGDEAKYVALVHELAHALQAIRGELVMSYSLRKEWYEHHHEQDAIRWSAKQAKRMGWSVKRLRRLFENRYQHHQDWIETVVREGKIGFKLDPRQETLPLLQRRPIWVKRHRRRW